MKKLKKMMALIIAVAMVIAMTLPVMAEQTQPDGSITVKSPVVGASYTAYQIFEMTTNADNTSFSYTIVGTGANKSPFYDAVAAYAATETNGLKLSQIGTTGVYNVSVTDDFDPQAFGKAMEAVISGASSVAHTPNYGKDSENNALTVVSPDSNLNTTDQIVFDDGKSQAADPTAAAGLPLGYYLITATYPTASYGSVTMTVPGSEAAEDKYVFTKDDLDADGKLTAAAKGRIAEYVGKVVTDDYVTAYIAQKDLKNDDGSALTSEQIAQLKTDLTNDMQADAESKVQNAFDNQLAGSGSDINVKEPVLVFVDTTTPDAVINEKNELDKWDVPVNPSGDATPENLPDHGEPKGGKNIVINDNPEYYADWSEANIGDSVHYQLRVNAMNYVNESTTAGDDTKIKQVKEYFLADYQNAHMTFDASKYLRVRVFDGNGENVTKNAAGESVQYLDFTDTATTTFFKNNDGNTPATKPTDIIGDGTGIMVPWVKVAGPFATASNPTPDPTYPIYTTSVVAREGEFQTWNASTQPDARHDDAGYLLDKDGNRIPVTDTYYVYSLYTSDVTIVADYWMTLDDDAVVDEPGNPNYAQYAYRTVEPKDQKPNNPSDSDKPSQKKEVDEATVYTYAIAWVKINKSAESLANAKFQLPFYVKATKDGNAYVYGGETAGNGLTNEVTTDSTGVITIKGLTAGTYSITETEAPVGYNLLTEPFEVEAKKSGNGETVKTETVIYLDANGEVTDTETTRTVTKNTDTDSFNNANATGTEETSVPVYQFDPIMNLQGTELPSTGGIGTTIFYVIGTILVIGAGVVLITKRRMDA